MFLEKLTVTLEAFDEKLSSVQKQKGQHDIRKCRWEFSECFGRTSIRKQVSVQMLTAKGHIFSSRIWAGGVHYMHS